MPDPTDPPAAAGASAPALTPEDRARAERLIYRIRCGLTGNAEDAGTIERLLADRDRLARERAAAKVANDLLEKTLRALHESWRELQRERNTLQASAATLAADNARLMEELDGTECSHEDEEAAHLETLGMLGVANARLAALADVARQIQARGATMTFWAAGAVARVEYTVTAEELAVLLADARTPGEGPK